jgi:ParB family chromosome partitioning protein
MIEPHPQNLPVNQLQPNPLQPRGKVNPDDLAELVISVKQYGVLEPIIVAHTPAGYQIIAGERRWRAAKLAGLSEVPVLVKVTTPKGMLEMAIIENVQRVDLSALERAQAFQQLIRDFKFSVSQISEKIGKSLSYITNTIRLIDLPDAIKDGLAGNLITEGHARAIAGLEDERAQIEVYKIILRENATVRRAEELVRRVKHQLPVNASIQPKQETSKPVPFTGLSKHLDEWQSQLQSYFNPETSEVKLSQSNRQTKVVIVFKGNPEFIEKDIKMILNRMKANQQPKK